MSATTAIIQLDARGIFRDNVMLINVGLSTVTAIIITVLGLYQDDLPGWAAWFPFMVALSIVSGPGGFGYMFGLLMVDEGDTGVRQALAITPVPPIRMILTRTVIAMLWLCIWPVLTISLMNASWQVLDLPVLQWAAVIGSVAILAPVFALAVPLLAEDKVGALAVFKGLTFVTLIPLATYLIEPDAWYRLIFLVSPTGWAIQAFDAFVQGETAGYWWATGCAVYNLALLSLCVHFFQKNIYQAYN
jgi:hypothetical protein